MIIRSAGCLFLAAAGAFGALYDVEVETGSRRTGTGDTVGYQLFIPKAPPASVAPGFKFPAVVLTHGFARNYTFHEANARYLAQRGIVVLTPNTSSLFGSDGQTRNILNLADHVGWLITRSLSPGDKLFGLVNPVKIALAGHSAGGALSFDATWALQSQSYPVAAVVLLDGVPWSRTFVSASRMRTLPFASLRAEPSACNANASVLGLQNALRFATEDVRITGATHCDPENPTDFFCRLVCGGSSAERQGLYQRLLYVFLRDTFSIPELDDEVLTYQQLLAALQASGQVAVTPVPAREQ